MEESFKALSERIVSFMVNSMVEIYEQLDKKNADKVYNILSKESVECFNIKLHPISPPPIIALCFSIYVRNTGR